MDYKIDDKNLDVSMFQTVDKAPSCEGAFLVS